MMEELVTTAATRRGKF